MLSCVVAVARNGVIGNGNQLPWHLPADLKRFKALTLGKPMIMGRKTYESIGRPLPGRTNIVVSRQHDLSIEGCIVAGSLPDAIRLAGAAPEITLIGGAELFSQALATTEVIHLTRVHADVPGDVFFPPLSSLEWHETLVARHEADDRHAYAFSFLELTRK
jgi:dihydrofolate reductase